MKICLINNLYPPYSRGGSERVIELAINELVKNNQVLLITTQPQPGRKTESAGNFKIVRFYPNNLYYLLADGKQPLIKKFFWHFYDLFGLANMSFINKEIADFCPQIVITHNLTGLGLQTFSAIKKLGVPHIHVLHDYQLIDPHGSLYRQGQNLAKIGWFYRIYVSFTKKLIKSPNLVISPSKFVLDKHLEYGFFKRSKITVLPNPAELVIDAELSGLSKTKHQPTVDNQIRFLFLGQMEEHKGVEFLVKAFMSWPDKNSRLTLAGGGSQLKLINSLVKNDERINLLGQVERGRINELFAESDVLIVPSVWWENSPTVIYEAYANKIPVLVSDSGGAKELVRSGQTGWVFESNNQNELIGNFKKIISEKLLLPKYGQNGFEFIKDFSADKYVNKLLELCRSLKQ